MARPANDVSELHGMPDPFTRVTTFWQVLRDRATEARQQPASMYFDAELNELIIPIAAAAKHLTSSPHNPVPAGGSLATTYFFLQVGSRVCNQMGNLHGGAAATIYDVVTSVALACISKKGFWENVGTSRNLDVTYLRPAPYGSRIIIGCEVLGAGKKTACVRGWMRRLKEPEGGAVAELSQELLTVDDLRKLIPLDERGQLLCSIDDICEGDMLNVCSHDKAYMGPPKL